MLRSGLPHSFDVGVANEIGLHAAIIFYHIFYISHGNRHIDLETLIGICSYLSEDEVLEAIQVLKDHDVIENSMRICMKEGV